MTAAARPLPPGPPKPPTPGDAADRAAFDRLVDGSLASTRAAAEKWRTGLAALVTLATTALFLKGPESANDLPGPWRYVVPVLLLLGLAAAVVGLHLALRAASGTPLPASYDEIVAAYGSIRSAEVAAATKAATQLEHARQWVMLSLALFLAGLLGWWLAPSATPKVTVSTNAEVVCGELVNADSSTIRLAVDGRSGVVAVPVARVVNLTVSRECK